MVVAAAAAAAVVAAGLIWLVARPGADDPAAGVPPPAATTASAGTGQGAAATTAPSASAEPSAAPVASRATPARPPLPAGWIERRDPTGFSVYVPKGWKRSHKGSMVYFRDPRTGRSLGIDQTTKPAKDPVADWRGKAAYRVDRGDFPGYREIRIDAVRYWQKAADWEFTFAGSNRRHVNNRGVITSKKQAYGIYWETSDARWKADRDDLQLIFDSFRPKT